MLQDLLCKRYRCSVVTATMRCIQLAGNGAQLLHQFLAPLGECDLLVTAFEQQDGFTPPLGCAVLVLRQRGNFSRCVGRAIRQQAVQQAVSYTHLDVYKRQCPLCMAAVSSSYLPLKKFTRW